MNLTYFKVVTFFQRVASETVSLATLWSTILNINCITSSMLRVHVVGYTKLQITVCCHFIIFTLFKLSKSFHNAAFLCCKFVFVSLNVTRVSSECWIKVPLINHVVFTIMPFISYIVEVIGGS